MVGGNEPGLMGRAVPHTWMFSGTATDLDVWSVSVACCTAATFPTAAEHPTYNLNVQGHIQELGSDMFMSVDVVLAFMGVGVWLCVCAVGCISDLFS